MKQLNSGGCMSKQTTAVEWLAERIECLNIEEFWAKWDEFKQQAITMEREQIETAYIVGIIHPLEMEASKQAKEYYNDTYGIDSNHSEQALEMEQE